MLLSLRAPDCGPASAPAPAMYQEFRIKISRRAGGGYELAASGPGGEADGAFGLPFDEKDLRILILEMGVPRGLTRGVESPAAEAARRIGGGLYGALFQGEVGELFVGSRAMAEAHDEPLRVTLALTDAADLMHLPWEYLYDAERGLFLATSRRTPVVRYLEIPSQRRPMLVRPPLRVLAMVSSPSDVATLDVGLERDKLERALEGLSGRGLVSITWLETATFEALQDELRNPGYHVFHYVGHGGFDPAEDESVLLLETEDGRSLRVTGEQLGTLLFDHTSLSLAVLNACEAARVSVRDPFAGVATTLVRREVPAVIAMQFPITDAAAIRFSGELYRAIADGLPVDAALGEARKGMFAADPKSVEWGTPVLFMRVADGRIFDLDLSAVPPAPPAEAPPPAPVEAEPAGEREPGPAGGSGPQPSAEQPPPGEEEGTAGRRGWARRHGAVLGAVAALAAAAVAAAVVLTTGGGGPETPTGAAPTVQPTTAPGPAPVAGPIEGTVVALDPAGGRGALSAAWPSEQTVAYVDAREFDRRPLRVLPADGSGGAPETVAVGPLVRNDFPSYSAGGDLVFQSNVGGQGWNLYVLLQGGTSPELIAGGPGERGDQVTPAWSPDGTEVAYASSSDQGAPFDLWVTDLSGRATALTLPDDESWDEFFPAWSPTGEQLAFVRAARGGGCRRGVLWVAGYDAATRSLTAARPLVQGADDVRHPSWGPDGRIVYSASAGGRYSLSVVDPAQASPSPRPVELGGGAPADAIDPSWSPRGDRVAFTGGTFTCTHAKWAPWQGFVSDPTDRNARNLVSRAYVATLGE